MRHEIKFPFHAFTTARGLVVWALGAEVAQDRMGGNTFTAHGEGLMIITEISRHTPKGFGEKVFFTREFVDPDGNKAGSRRLDMRGQLAFSRMIKGLKFDYEIVALEKHHNG